MGADIYLESVYEPNHAKCRAAFDAAVKIRDALPRNSVAAEEAQKAVSRTYDEMYSRGYFRDCYNSFGLFAQTNISWWRDVSPMLDDNSYLPIEKAKELLTRLQAEPLQLGPKPPHKNPFDGKMYPTESPGEDKRDEYEKWRDELVEILTESIALNEPLRCSL